MMNRILLKIFFVELKKAKRILRKYKETEDIITDEITLNGKTYACITCDLSNNGALFPDLYLEKEETFEELQDASENSLELY